MRNQVEKGIRAKQFVQLLVVLYGVCCLWLFYNQSIAILQDSGNGPFQSDLPLHLSMVLEDGWYYSFTAIIYQLLDIVFFGHTIGVAIFLCGVAMATVYATKELLAEFGFDADNWSSLLLALALNFVMPIFIPAVGEFRYVSYQSGNIWHNSTYLCMRLAAVITLIAYFRLEKTYREGLTAKQWVTFALLNILCTGIKPSFLVVYSPIVGVYLLIDLLKGVPLKRILAFGSALLPSGGVIVWQNMVLFGQDTGSSIEIGPWVNFSQHTNIPKVAVLLSILFCVVVLLMVMVDSLLQRKLLLTKQEVFVGGMTALGFLEAVLFVESGYRAAAGNFLWGYFFSIFALFVMCARIWMQMGRDKLTLTLKWICGAIFAWHLYCGIYFFALLVSGVGYFM